VAGCSGSGWLACLRIPDLVIAAAVESFGLTVLHYDADFEHIAEVTGQSHDWVVPRGTV
jgi:predicted nucleic acid-binding protein